MSSFRQTKTRFKRSRAAMYVAAVAGILGFGFLMYMAATAQRGLPARSYYDLTAEFRDAVNLSKFSEVRLAGKRVGQVLSLSTEDGLARVRLQMNSADGPVPADTTARIRLKGLLGAKFVDLVPGKSTRMLADGATIPPARTSKSDDLIDTLQSLDAPRRAALQTTIGTLGAGFAGRGADLNDALRDSPPALRDLSAIARAINARSGAAARLVPSTEAGVGAVDPVREDFARGLDPGARALEPFVDRRPDVQSTLEVGPSALATLRSGLAQTDPLLAETAGFARATVALTRPAPRALRRTAALLRESRRPLQTARVLLRRLQAAVAPTLRLTRSVDPLIAPVIRVLANSRPLLTALGPARCDMLGMWRNWRSMLAYGPAEGGGEYGPATMLRATVDVTGDVVGDTTPRPTALIGRNPYAAPCTSVTEKPR